MEAWAAISSPTHSASSSPPPPDASAPTATAATSARSVADGEGRAERARLILLAVGGGLLTSLATPPWGLWPLGIVGLAVLAWLLLRTAGLGWRRRWVLGFAWAAGMFGVTLFWMSEFHAVGYAAASIGYAAFYGTAVAAVPLLSRDRLGGIAALAPALTTVEWIRDRFPFGGVPLGSIEIGQAAGPLVPAARLFGGLSLLALAAVLGAALAAVVWQAGAARRRPHTISVAATAALAALGVPVLGLAAPDGGGDVARLRVGVVQGGGERGLRAVFTDSNVVFERHSGAANRLQPPLDLVVWPENAIDVPALTGSRPARTLAALARRLDATVVAGVTEDADNDRFVNVAYAWSPDGEVVDGYIKVKRVPFGEYVPGRALFERIVDLSILPRDAVAGNGSGVLRTPAGDFGVAISYEVFFADRTRDAVRAGAEVLLVPTNASSFTTSQVPTQQVAAARLRAWETGRWVVQAAPTGYSAVIEPDGTVLRRSILGREQVLESTVARRTGRTLYTVWGDAPLVALSLVVMGGAWALSRTGTRSIGRRRRAVSDPSPALDRPVNF